MKEKYNKIWPDKFLNQRIGSFLDAYICHAPDHNVRLHAASGGTVSSLLIWAKDKKLIDGALVCRTGIVDAKIRPQFFIAKTKEDILAAGGSKYVASPFAKEAIPLIKELQGKLAVVGLPCDMAVLQNLFHTDPQLKQKVVLAIALFCGHNSQPELIDHVAGKLERQAKSTIISYQFRVGHWRGNLRAVFKSGQVIEKPFDYFSLYQNLYFFAERKCLYCNDHFGYHADIAVGDLWSLKYKKDPIKHSGVIVKTEQGRRLFSRCMKDNYIIAESVSIREIMYSQRRTAMFHYDLSSRHYAGKLLGMQIPDKTGLKVNWHSFLAALIVVFNWKWSQSKRFSRLIWKIPRFLLKLYLYIFKALESLG